MVSNYKPFLLGIFCFSVRTNVIQYVQKMIGIQHFRNVTAYAPVGMYPKASYN